MVALSYGVTVVMYEKKQPSSDIDIEDYFDGCFGINHSDDQKPEIIRIKAINTQAEYINALPIHESQILRKMVDNYK